MTDCVLKASGICKAFNGVSALKNVDLEIHKGEIHCLGGENGSGKSTLIHIISGNYQMDAGLLELNGNRYKKITPPQAIQEGVQVIFQDFAVFPNLTVKENIAMNTLVSEGRRTVDRKRVEQIAQRAIDMIGVKLDLNERVENISVADKQLVAICRAIVNHAKLLIMDEATTALTKNEIRHLFDTMLELKAQGISILFVSHKLDEVFQICDKYTIIRDGENVVSGVSEKLDEATFSYYMTGRRFTHVPFQPASVGAEPNMEVSHLCCGKYYNDVSFQVYPGEIVGFTGLLGSGRRELALSLFGILPYKGGEIRIKGRRRSIRSVNDAISCGIGYIPEDRLTEGVFPERAISENLTAPSLKQMSGRTGILNKKRMLHSVQDIAASLQIKTKNVENAVQTLSGGNQQRVVLGKWFMRDMDILILNAPTVGVDVGSKYDIHEMVKKQAQANKSVIVVSDDISELLNLTNRIYIMKNGRIADCVNTRDTDSTKLEDAISG